MTQSVVIQVGQCGNQIGYRFWDLAIQEHIANKLSLNEEMNSFFRPVNSKKSNNFSVDNVKARAVLIDMEEGVISSILKGPLCKLFDSQQLVTDVSGSGNNWAVGHKVYGAQYRDKILEMLRRESEMCDNLQCFFLLHSMGGGTGSGLGTAVLEMLCDEFSEKHRFVTAVYPSIYDDVITSPYNTVLANSQLTEYANCVIPVENKALTDMCNYVEKNLNSSKCTAGLKPKSIISSVGITSNFMPTKPFDPMNNVIANLLLNLTCSSRFPGSLNVDLNEIVMNMVPFTHLHYLTSSIAPLFSLAKPSNCIQSINQMFTEAFPNHHYLFPGDIKKGVFLACAILIRGQAQMSDVQKSIDRLRCGLRFVPWNEEGWKTGLCSVPPLGCPYSALMLANSSSIWKPFAALRFQFLKMYQKKAHLHHFLEVDGMEKEVFDVSLNTLDTLIDEYRKLETVKSDLIQLPRMTVLV